MNWQSLTSHFTALIALLFPEYCIGCKVQGSLLCLPCLARVARAEVTDLPNVFCLFSYQHPYIKKSVQLLKYKNSKSLGKVFGSALSDYLLEILAEEELFAQENKGQEWVLVPIPLSQERLKTRGYNQATLIGQHMVDKEHVRVTIDNSILYKGRDTTSQVRIKDRKSRLANPKGSFAVRDACGIVGRNCIVLDDVVTTGATIREAMRTLKRAGAKRVIGLSVAH